MSRSDFAKAKRIVIKIGSALLTEGGKGLNKAAIAVWVAQMAKLKQQGIEVVLVSSGFSLITGTTL
jgi:glutamate 5-kinase